MSDKAVHVDDRASAIFVLAVVGVFIAIFVFALLFGYGGFFGNVFPKAAPTPTAGSASRPLRSASALRLPEAPVRGAPASPRAPERLAGRQPVGGTLSEPLGELTPVRWTSARIARAMARARMVAAQLRDRGIKDARVLDVMAASRGRPSSPTASAATPTRTTRCRSARGRRSASRTWSRA